MADSILQSIQKMIIDSTLNSTTICQSTISGDQELTISCRNDLLDHYESNPACVKCMQTNVDNMKNQFALQISEWNTLNPSSVVVKQDINSSYTQFMNGIESCVDVCKMCKIEDTSQTSIIELKSTCEITSEEYTNIANEIVAKASSSTYISNGDIDKVIQSLSGGTDRDAMRLTLAQLINQNMTVDIIAGMLAAIRTKQSINIESTGSSSIRGIHQSTLIALASDYLSSSKFNTNFTNTQEWKSIEQYYQKSTTLDDVGQVVVKTVNSITYAADSVLSSMVYILGALIILTIIIYMMTFFI